MMIAQYIPFAVAALLIAATLMDLRTGKIPNLLIYACFGLFIVLVGVSPDKAAYGWQLLFALGAFALGLMLYAGIGAGAGAVKLLACAALFVPIGRPFALFGILLLSLFVLGLAVTILRSMIGGDDSKWVVLSKRVMPLSLPVAVTGLIGMFWL